MGRKRRELSHTLVILLHGHSDNALLRSLLSICDDKNEAEENASGSGMAEINYNLWGCVVT